MLVGHDRHPPIGEVHAPDHGLDHVTLLEQAAVEREPIASLGPGIIHAAAGVIVVRQGSREVEAPGQPWPPLHMTVRMGFEVSVILSLEHRGTVQIERPVNDIQNAHPGCRRWLWARWLSRVFVHGYR